MWYIVILGEEISLRELTQIMESLRGISPRCHKTRIHGITWPSEGVAQCLILQDAKRDLFLNSRDFYLILEPFARADIGIWEVRIIDEEEAMRLQKTPRFHMLLES